MTGFQRLDREQTREVEFFELQEPIYNEFQSLESSFIAQFAISHYQVDNSRQVYNILDLFSDVGGLRDIFGLFGTVIMYFYSLIIRNSLNDKLLSALFKVEVSKKKTDPATQSRLKQIRSRSRFETLLCKWCRNKKYQRKE